MRETFATYYLTDTRPKMKNEEIDFFVEIW